MKLFSCRDIFFAAFYLLFLSSFSIYASDSAAIALERGWEEYGYGIFDIARRHFKEVAADRKADKAEQAQALIGLAFCSHFGKGASVTVTDFEEALRNYSAALEKAAGDAKMEPFIQSMMAECYFMIYLKTGNKKELDRANSIWDAMLAKDRYSIYAANGVLYRIAFGTGEQEDMKAKSKFLEEYLEGAIAKKDLTTDEKIFLPAMSRLLGEIFIVIKDYPKAVRWFEEYLRFGATNQVLESQILFKIARIYELEIGNKAKAAEYYRKFKEKNPNDLKTYFAIEKMEQLSNNER